MKFFLYGYYMFNNVNHIDYMTRKRKFYNYHNFKSNNNINQILKPINNINQNLKPINNINQNLKPINDINQNLKPINNINQNLKPNMKVLPKIDDNLQKTNFYKDPLPSIYKHEKDEIYYKSNNKMNPYRNISNSLQIGDDIGNRYEIKNKISRGAFGIVISCYDHKNKEMVAIKCPAKNDYNKLIKIESEIYHKVGGDNPYIMNVKKFISHNYQNYLVMEKLDKNLYLWRKNNKPDINKIKDIILQIMKGIKYLHNKNIVHADLKPENIVFTDNTYTKIKIADLGNGVFEYELNKYSIMQTRYYRAPEVILQTHKNKSIDIWSIGCIICELITGTPIFFGKTENSQLFAIMEYLGIPSKNIIKESRVRYHYFNYTYRPKTAYGYYIKSKSLNKLFNDKDLLDLLNKMFDYDNVQRINIDDCINHKWFNSNLE
jgi:dual specificity tyrosine-phosphorylation-regulated kinase 2/3/4